MTVWIYVDTSKDAGDPDHLKVFANEAAADRWSAENDPEGVAFAYPLGARPESADNRSIPGECELVHTHVRSSVAISFAEEPSHDQTTCEAYALVGRDRRVGDPRIGDDHRGRGLDCSVAADQLMLPGIKQRINTGPWTGSSE